jgi:HEAT repeat protein
MDASEVIARLEAPADDEQAVFDELRDSAPAEALVEALASAQDPWTRMLVADMLGQRAEPAAIAPLVAVLGDEDEQVRRAAAGALRRLFLVGGATGGVKAASDVVGAASDVVGAASDDMAASGDAGAASDDARAASRDAGAAGDDAGAALLARYAAEDDPKVRRALASALGAARYRPAARPLRAALESDDPALVVAAKHALHLIEAGPALSSDDVLDALGRPSADGWALMDQLLEDASTGALVDALGRAGDTSTRRALADLLGFRGDASAAEPLADLLDDPDEGVRASAADALGKVFMADPPPPPDAARRVGAAMLARFEAEQSLPVLTTLASALGASRYEPALPALRAARESGERSLARQAAWGLHWLEGTPPPD